MIYIAGTMFVLNFLIGICLYFLGRENGKLREKNEQKAHLLMEQASAFSRFEARMDRYDARMDTIKNKIDSVDISILPDSDLQLLFKDPTSNLSTDSKTVPEIKKSK